jgi:hypothetical protein
MQSKLIPLLQAGRETGFHDVLSDQVEFHSPVTDYRGPADVAHLLATIRGLLDGIEVQRELSIERETITVMTASRDGRRIDGMLDEIYDERGLVKSATLMLRPLAALREAIADMADALEHSPLPSRR